MSYTAKGVNIFLDRYEFVLSKIEVWFSILIMFLNSLFAKTTFLFTVF
jgi:hypothetical protein